jgi:hypothetical protein
MSYYNPIWRRRSSSGGGGGPPDPGGVITLNSWNYEQTKPTASCTCAIYFRYDRLITGHGNPDYVWLTGGNPADFDLVVQHIAGDDPNGPLNVALPFSGTAVYQYTASVGAPGNTFTQFRATITQRANPANTATAIIRLDAIATGYGGGGGGGFDGPIE